MDIVTIVIHNIQNWLHRQYLGSVEDPSEPTLPVELLNADQLERFATTLAMSHELAKKSATDRLLACLSKSEATLIKSCEILTQSTTENAGYSPAREWLLDNFYLIQEQIHTIRHNLPKGYGKGLPKLTGNKQGYPRIYDITVQIITHSDGRWDLENLSRFIMSYQSIKPLTLGELWATPICLGVALIENISILSKRIVLDRDAHKLADLWADRMIDAAVSNPRNLVIIIADMVRAEPSMSSTFVSELSRRLQAGALTLPLSWIEQHLAGEGLSIEQLVQEEIQRQAANQVTISNSIDGLRRLIEVDWHNFVESMSVVEQILLKDPSDTYRHMDFGTRDRYRHVVERLARTCIRSESEVATAAIQLATTHANLDNVDKNRSAHVGFSIRD